MDGYHPLQECSLLDPDRLWANPVYHLATSIIRRFSYHVSMSQLYLFERSPPKGILTDKDKAFNSRKFRMFAEMWGDRVNGGLGTVTGFVNPQPL